MANRLYLTTLFFSLFFYGWFPVASEARVYKWVDGEGKAHYTNNKSAIPREFLTKEHKDKPKPPPSEPAVPGEIMEGENESLPAAVEGEQLSDEEARSLIEEAKTYLEKQNKRFERLTQIDVNLKNGKYFIKTAQMGLTEKANRIEKYQKAGVPLLLPVASFLKESLVKDQKQEIEDREDMLKLKELQKRFVQEYGERIRLIKSLEAVLDKEAG